MSWLWCFLQCFNHLGSCWTTQNVHKLRQLPTDELVLPNRLSCPISSVAAFAQIPWKKKGSRIFTCLFSWLVQEVCHLKLWTIWVSQLLEFSSTIMFTEGSRDGGLGIPIFYQQLWMLGLPSWVCFFTSPFNPKISLVQSGGVWLLLIIVLWQNAPSHQG